MFPEIPGSGWSGVHQEPRHLYLSSEAGKTLWGKFPQGSWRGWQELLRSAPLGCCSALLFWPQLCCGAPGSDVTKLVSTLLLPHPHPFPVAVISGQALSTECPPPFWVSRAGGPSPRWPGDKVGSVYLEVGVFGSGRTWELCGDPVSHTYGSGENLLLVTALPLTWEGTRSCSLQCHLSHLQNGFVAIGSRGDRSCFRLPKKLGHLSFQTTYAQPGLEVGLKLSCEKCLC